MGSNLDLGGVYVPLITPFEGSSDQSPVALGDQSPVALGELERLANESLDAGATGLVALGTTGEPATLDDDERRAVIETVGSVCRQRQAAFIIGAGTNNTKATIEAAKQAALSPRLTAILSVVPYYTRPSEAGIVSHFGAVAEASPVPVVVYNIPYRTGRGLGSASLLRLASTPNIAGLKQAVGGIDQDTLELMAEKPDNFHVLCGDDPYLYSLMTLGGSGAIAASAHVCTSGFVALVDAALKGETGARQIHEILLPVCKFLFTEPSPGIVKGVLAYQGRISSGSLRLPMTAGSDAGVAAATAAVKKAESLLASMANG